MGSSSAGEEEGSEKRANFAEMEREEDDTQEQIIWLQRSKATETETQKEENTDQGQAEAKARPLPTLRRAGWVEESKTRVGDLIHS